MLLAIDVGNTNMVFGIYDKEKLDVYKRQVQRQER